MHTPIPSPPGLPFVGNVDAIDKDLPLQSLHLLAKQYGDIYQLTMFGDTRIIVNSSALMSEVSDEKRFAKKIAANSNQLRNAAGDGLFTSDSLTSIEDRLLMPIFTPASVCNIADDMLDIVSQLVLKWERFGANTVIDVASDFSRVTLDTICLTAMSYRLNSFYRESLHPFALAMADFLLESTKRGARSQLVQSALIAENAKYDADQKTLFSVADDILAQRRANPTDRQDILNILMYGVDKETGRGLPEKTIQYNVRHETTSGMLVFAVYYLLTSPETLRKLREEIDTKIGGRLFTTTDLNTLPYLIAVMRETLRLSPTAPARTVAPFEDVTIGGKYFVRKGQSIIVNTYDCQRDRKVWGDDADEFKPERMLDGKYEALPGGAFAWQEGQIALVTILQHFDLVMDDPHYELQLKQTLSIKPKNFNIRATPRKDKPRLFAVPSINKQAAAKA
ncbi:cytochrome P450 [Polyporus arcularius HHB13444]|uniref:Cytochrome P450 n=1 Tax=Polyporus arcularius HHB13444 TaxID=1314778 RepID=A0A5C3PFX3_9APHY|nr:cytochrome P450 [Polyporus arcularius HHB13444]